MLLLGKLVCPRCDMLRELQGGHVHPKLSALRDSRLVNIVKMLQLQLFFQEDDDAERLRQEEETKRQRAEEEAARRRQEVQYMSYLLHPSCHDKSNITIFKYLDSSILKGMLYLLKRLIELNCEIYLNSPKDFS